MVRSARVPGARWLCAAAWLVAARATAQSPAPAAGADRYQTLGRLEREAVDEAILARGLVVDPAPGGKTIGTIHVVNHEVFSARDGFFRLANYFHRTTREPIIRREVLLAPGDRYDETLVEETVRNLRDVDFSGLVVILPVRSVEPGVVDLLVVTRDVWSLRFNTDLDFQKDVLVYLTTSLSENNLFGWRKKASLGFNLLRGSYSYGPSYQDANVAGTRLAFSVSYLRYHDRATDRPEGSSVGARVDFPLYSLASRWGASVSAGHTEGVSRRYDQDGLFPVDLAGTPEIERLPQIYRIRRSSAGASVVRSFPGAVTQRVSGGYSFSVTRARFHESFPVADPAVRAAFAAQVFPHSERLSSVYAGYSLFTPRYRVYRDLETYDLREDAQLGPGLSLSLSHGATWMGSDYDFVGLGASVGWSFDRWDGYQRLSAGWGGRILGGRLVDESRSVSGTFASPVLGRAVRLVADASASVLLRNTRPEVYLSVGGDSGLRGYGIGDFYGFARAVGHLELRTRPLAIKALRLGAVAFHDVGHAAPRFADLHLVHDAGFGLRLLIPQLNAYVLRVDWAVPFQRGRNTLPGLPGRISAGFRQGF